MKTHLLQRGFFLLRSTFLGSAVQCSAVQCSAVQCSMFWVRRWQAVSESAAVEPQKLLASGELQVFTLKL